MEYLSAYMAGVHQVKYGIGNIFYCRLLYNRLCGGFVWVVGVHWCIHNARSYGIEADPILCILDREVLGRRIQAALRNHRDRAVSASDWPICKRRSDGHNTSGLLFQHLFHGTLSDVEESKQIGRDQGVEILDGEVEERLV